MSESKRRGSFEERKQQSLLRLASAMTGRPIDIDQLQILDQAEFAKVAKWAMDQVITGGQTEARAQDDGRLEIYSVRNRQVTHLGTIPAGKWRELTREQRDAAAVQITANRAGMDMDALVRDIADAMSQREEQLSGGRRMLERSDGVLIVADRSAHGLSALTNAEDIPQLLDAIEAWLAGDAAFALCLVTPEAKRRRVLPARDEDGVASAFGEVKRIVGRLDNIALILPELEDSASQRLHEAWQALGGRRPDEIVSANAAMPEPGAPGWNAFLADALGTLPQHQQNVFLLFDDSDVGRQALAAVMQSGFEDFREPIARNLPALQAAGAKYYGFLGTIGYSGGATMAALTLGECLQEMLPAVFDRVLMKGGMCMTLPAVDAAALPAIHARLAELEPTFEPGGAPIPSPALVAYRVAKQSALQEPAFGGVAIAFDEVILDPEWLQRVRGHFQTLADASAAQGDRAQALRFVRPFAERMADGSLKLYVPVQLESLDEFDVPAGKWRSRAEHYGDLAGTPAASVSDQPLHGGRFIPDFALPIEPWRNKVTVIATECINDWALHGRAELDRMRAAGQAPFFGEEMPDGSLRVTFRWSSGRTRLLDIPKGEWTEATNAEPETDAPQVKARAIIGPRAPGMPPSFYLPRQIIESEELGLPLSALTMLSGSRSTGEAYRHSMWIEVDGYDDDPRELWDIPEVVAYFRRLNEAWPYWFYFIPVESNHFALLLRLLCESQGDVKTGMLTDLEAAAQTVDRCLSAVADMLKTWGGKSTSEERDGMEGARNLLTLMLAQGAQ